MNIRPALAAVAIFTAMLNIPATMAADSAKKPQRWNQFVDEFLDAYFQSRPDFAVNAGRHEFDGQLPDWSPEGLHRKGELLRQFRTRALEFDLTRLNERERFEREFLAARIDGDLFWLERANWPAKNPQFYAEIGFGLDPSVCVTRPYAPLKQRLRAFTAYAKAVPRAVAQIKQNLRSPLPRTYLTLGTNTFGPLAGFLEKDVPAVFASVRDEKLQAEFREATALAARALAELNAWFTAQTPTATEQFALGPELFREMLWATERVDVSLDELESVGRRDLERNLASLREACAAYAPGKSIPECLERMSGNKPKGGPVEGARRQLSGLKRFLVEHRVVSIPSREECQVEESPPYQRWNFAYINIPGPFEKNLPSVYYIAPPDPTWPKAEQEAYLPPAADLLFTSVHEVWPGHFLQFLHSNRSKSKLGRVFVGYAFAEGWAHYAEELMWEAGLGRSDPETHIGQLLNALLRNVRFLSAIGLHTGRMTEQDSERMFREQAFQDPGNARQQAARGTFDPAYLNYTMGKLMIRKLREDWCATRGGPKAWREFHDRILSYGGPPLPLVRRAMLGAAPGALF